MSKYEGCIKKNGIEYKDKCASELQKLRECSSKVVKETKRPLNNTSNPH